MEQILSQDEVDALLKGISGGELEEPEEQIVASELEYTPYDFSRQERIVQARMPAMDIINDVFLRSIRNSLSSTLRKVLDIASVPLEMERFGAFIRTLPVPSSLQIFKMDPFRGHALIVMEPKLVFTLVENFLGGSGARNIRIEGRDFTAIEQRLILRVVTTLLNDLEKAWQSVHPIKIKYVRSEINPQFAKICEPENIVIINRYEVDMDRPIGSITTCIPMSNLESVKHKLMSTFQREKSEEDLLIQQILNENLKNLPVDLVVQLGTTTITTADVLELGVGDILQLDQRREDLLPVFVSGKRKFMGSPGLHRGNKSLLIRRKVLDPERD